LKNRRRIRSASRCGSSASARFISPAARSRHRELLDKQTLDEDAIRGYKAAMGTRSSAPASRAPVAA
jgi:hypothetical protein